MRYFVVFYFYNYSDGVEKKFGAGMTTMHFSGFPSHAEMIDKIKANSNSEIIDESVVINNWKELSKDDYTSFLGEKNAR